MEMKEETKLRIISDSDFYKLSQEDISHFVKLKQNFSYFQWADAHQLMKNFDPNAEVKEAWFEHFSLLTNEQGTFTHVITKKFPYQITANSSFVEVFVTFKGKVEKEIYPILDYRNQDIPNPTMTQVNKALKRAFVKALAKHGLGLYIYRGEDLPDEPIITLKELEKLEVMIDSLDNLVNQKTTTALIERTNKILKQDFAHLNLKPITKIESMTKEQYGLFLRVLNDAKMKAEDTEKEKKKEQKAKK